MNSEEFCFRYLRGERDFEGVELNSLSINDEMYVAAGFERGPQGLNFRNATFSGWNLKEISFLDCDFSGATFFESYLQESSFYNSNLQRVVFNHFDAVEIHFENSNLRNSSFVDCSINDTYFQTCDLSGSRWLRTFWLGGAWDCRFMPELIENLEMKLVDFSNTIFNEEILIDCAYRDITIDSMSSFISLITPLPTNDLSENDRLLEPSIEVISESGFDFSKLANLLAANNWAEADRETALIVVSLAGLQYEYPLFVKVELLDSIPCPELLMLDELWRRYSSGLYGLSVQGQMWHSEINRYSDVGDLRRAFCKQLKWAALDDYDDHRLIVYPICRDLESLAISGYLPAIGIWDIEYNICFRGEDNFERIYYRLSQCCQ